VTLKRDVDHVHLQIVDDGLGFDVQLPHSGRGIGLWSMCERVEQLGGQFEVQSASGQGTTLTAAVPL
jgi:signal transduction histidine kinase